MTNLLNAAEWAQSRSYNPIRPSCSCHHTSCPNSPQIPSKHTGPKNSKPINTPPEKKLKLHDPHTGMTSWRVETHHREWNSHMSWVFILLPWCRVGDGAPAAMVRMGAAAEARAAMVECDQWDGLSVLHAWNPREWEHWRLWGSDGGNARLISLVAMKRGCQVLWPNVDDSHCSLVHASVDEPRFPCVFGSLSG